MSIVPSLCEYFVNKAKLNPTIRDDRIILQTLCFLTIGKLSSQGYDLDDITIVAKAHGPHIPAVKEWCDQLVDHVY